MEALVTLSLVCNILQLVETAVKAFKSCKELYESEGGQVRAQHQAESCVKSLSAAVAALTTASPDPSQHTVDVQIKHVAENCDKTSQNLMEVLKLCQVGDSRGIRPLATAAWNVFRLRKDIQALLDTLESHQVQLSRLLVMSTNIKVHQVLGYHPSLQDATNSNVQALRRIENQLESFLSSSTSHELVSSIEVFQAVQRHVPRLLEHMYQQAVLNSLRRDGMTGSSRLSAILKATESTLGWVFASSAADRPYIKGKYHTPFVSWLREGSGFYHVQGKPGSGKSTLMKHIVNNVDTESHLRCWAGDRPLCVASFFFWKPGSLLQNTIRGLVSSLVYDILESFPHLALVAFPQYWQPEGYYLNWLSRTVIHITISYEAIFEGFQRLISHQGHDHPRFCFFIDGLDEYDDDSDDMSLGQLATLLQEWVTVSGENVKICVASREYQVFSDMADKKHQINLQDFTYEDIQNHVTESLSKNRRFRELQSSGDESCRDLIARIADHAEGVFLWVALLLPAIHTALDDDSSLLKLLDIVDRTPKKMETFLQSILDDIKPGLQYEAHLLLAVVLRWEGYLLSGRYEGGGFSLLDSLSVAILFEGLRTSKKLPADLKSSFSPPEDVDAWIARHETNIVSRSNGLVAYSLHHFTNSEGCNVVHFNHRSIPEFLAKRLKDSCKKQSHHITDDDVLMAIGWIFQSLIMIADNQEQYFPGNDLWIKESNSYRVRLLYTFFLLMGTETETENHPPRISAFEYIDSCSPTLDRLWESQRRVTNIRIWSITHTFWPPTHDFDHHYLIERPSPFEVAVTSGRVEYVQWKLRRHCPSSQIPTSQLNKALRMRVHALCTLYWPIDIFTWKLMDRSTKEERLLTTAEILTWGASPNSPLPKSHKEPGCNEIGNVLGTMDYVWHQLVIETIRGYLVDQEREEAWNTMELFFKNGVATSAVDMTINIEDPPSSLVRHSGQVTHGDFRQASLVLLFTDSEGLASSERIFFVGGLADIAVNGLSREEAFRQYTKDLHLRLPRHKDGTVRTGIQGWKLRDFITHSQPHNVDALLACLDEAEDERWKAIYAERERTGVKAESEKENAQLPARTLTGNVAGFIEEDTSWLSMIFVAMLFLWIAVLSQEFKVCLTRFGP